MYYHRNSIRLKNYDYSQNGMYFITICTKNREPILSKIIAKSMQTHVGADALICPNIKKQSTCPNFNNQSIGPNFDAKIVLKPAGIILNQYIQNINNVYKNVNVNSYVIMPDHFHMIIIIDNNSIKLFTEKGSMRASTPTVENKITISQIIKGIKSLTTRKIGYSIWQRNYYEHIIRNEKEYYRICEYIKNNPNTWKYDIY